MFWSDLKAQIVGLGYIVVYMYFHGMDEMVVPVIKMPL